MNDKNKYGSELYNIIISFLNDLLNLPAALRDALLLTCSSADNDRFLALVQTFPAE